ncbi:MAG: cytochrome c3 family protein [Polyangiaceae bacterium]|nr:cytochrome c3 family protein [Polyangiaceae bacterium]
MNRWLLFAVVVAALAALVQAPALAEGGDRPAPPPANKSASAANALKTWLPPAARPGDGGPSGVIFPPQNITIRMNHKLHVKTQKLECKACHPKALTSQASEDVLTPSATTCDPCHGTSHVNLDHVEQHDNLGNCQLCHLRDLRAQSGDDFRVTKLDIPPPNLLFSHKKHAARNIGCGQCHGDVAEIELATREQLPRMQGCVKCHQQPDSPASGDAKGACDTCHIKRGVAEGGLLRTVFPSGVLRPQQGMHNAEHTPDFLERHKQVAASDSALCANCHKEEYCARCHDGRVRPRSIHPSDYLAMHPVEARLATQKCTSCHREQSFCLTCHQRLGVSMSGPSGVREAGRFHPPKSVWSDPPRRPGHHAFEAMRNLDACVSCHIERDCVTCHGGQGIGGGFSPHPGNFASRCATQMRRNARPCLVCHESSASVLARCR